LNLLAYISTEEVLAVPEVPIIKAHLLQRADFGYNRMEFNKISVFKESVVGIRICENYNLSGGFHSSGWQIFHSIVFLFESNK
jgi:hypothetical protein